jgi:hypothetical protein
LRDHGLDRVLDQPGIPPILEAGGEPVDEPDRPLGRTKQQRPGIRRRIAAVECGLDPPPFDGCKSKQVTATLCRHRELLGSASSHSGRRTFADQEPRCTFRFEKCGLEQIERERPRVATVFHQHMARLIAGKLNDNNAALGALVR